jgi:hypothetical protein
MDVFSSAWHDDDSDPYDDRPRGIVSRRSGRRGPTSTNLFLSEEIHGLGRRFVGERRPELRALGEIFGNS